MRRTATLRMYAAPVFALIEPTPKPVENAVTRICDLFSQYNQRLTSNPHLRLQNHRVRSNQRLGATNRRPEQGLLPSSQKRRTASRSLWWVHRLSLAARASVRKKKTGFLQCLVADALASLDSQSAS